MITVNSNTRQFNIPGSDLVFGVTDDSTVERKHFQCPRFVGDNLDLAACFIRINYRNANGKTDFYLVDDMEISGDNITFSWLLSPRVTEYRGQVKFVMCAVGPDLKLKWHTTQGTGQVMEGLEPDNSHVESQTADVVAQLIAMVEAQTTEVERVGGEQIAEIESATKNATTAAVNEIEAKRGNSLASIPNDYTALSSTVESLVRGRGSVIVCEAEGTVVSVDDASDMAMQGMRIFGRSTQDGAPTPEAPVEIVSVESPVVKVTGKNLLAMPQTQTLGGVTFAVDNYGVVTVNGKATSTVYFLIDTFDFKAGGRYVISGCPEGGSAENYCLYVLKGQDDYVFEYGTGVTFNVEADFSSNVRILVAPGQEMNNVKFYPMIRLASVVDTAYEPPRTAQTVETAHPLRGIPVTSGGNYTDENGQQWICDEVDLERGVYIKRVDYYTNDGKVTSWRINQQDERTIIFATQTPCRPINRVMQYYNMQTFNWIIAPNSPHNSGAIGETGSMYCICSVDKFPDVESFVKYLGQSPLECVYPMATPIETSLTEAEIAAYRALHTNKPNTTILNDSGAYMSVQYAADTKLYIDKKIKEALK